MHYLILMFSNISFKQINFNLGFNVTFGYEKYIKISLKVFMISHGSMWHATEAPSGESSHFVDYNDAGCQYVT